MPYLRKSQAEWLNAMSKKKLSQIQIEREKENKRVDEKIAHLKALRLSKEAEDKKAEDMIAADKEAKKN